MFFTPIMNPPTPNISQKTNPDGTVSFNFSTPTSAGDVNEDVFSLPDLDRLYRENQEWAMEQAQKQMDFQTSANKLAMDFSSREADKARAWEAEMANSAYTRMMADLKKAGLNPILAYSQGGAAVPSVSAASGVSSVGSLASTSDTGYQKYNLDFEKLKLVINAATDIVGSLLSFAKAPGSVTNNVKNFYAKK